MVEDHLGSHVADAVVGHPGDVGERHHVVGVAPGDPQPVALLAQDAVEEPRCRRVVAQPHLAGVGVWLGPVGGQRPDRASARTPDVVALPHHRSQERQVASPDHQVDVVVRAGDASERIHRPAADHPPLAVIVGHEGGQSGRVQRVPLAVEPGEGDLLGDLVGTRLPVHPVTLAVGVRSPRQHANAIVAARTSSRCRHVLGPSGRATPRSRQRSTAARGRTRRSCSASWATWATLPSSCRARQGAAARRPRRGPRPRARRLPLKRAHPGRRVRRRPRRRLHRHDGRARGSLAT